MQESRYGEYIDLQKKEKELREKKKELEEKYLASISQEINEVVSAKESCRDEILQHMMDNNEKTHDWFGTNITRAEKKTLKIVDEEVARKHLFKENIFEKVMKLTGWKVKEVSEHLVETHLTSEAVKVIENLKASDGIEIKGVEEKVTNYLIVK